MNEEIDDQKGLKSLADDRGHRHAPNVGFKDNYEKKVQANVDEPTYHQG